MTGSQISALVALQVIGSSLALGSGDNARQDSWLSALFAVGLAVPVVWMYAAIFRLSPGKGFFDIVMDTFGQVGGRIFCGVYLLYAVFLGAQVFRILDEFIQLVNLPRTPQIAILAFSVPLVTLQVRCGLKNLASCAKFLLPIVLIFMVVMILLGLPFMDPTNILPIFGSGAEAVAQGTFYNFSLSLGETVLCLPLFEEVEASGKPFYILLKGAVVGGLTIMVITLRNILLLGAPVCHLYLFASYDAVGIISVGEFITRISVLIGINMVLAASAKVSVAVYSATLGVSKILGLRRPLQPAAPCAVLMAALSYTLYRSIITGMSMRPYLPYVSFPFQIFLPLLLLICGKIRKAGRSRKKTAAPKRRTVPAGKN